MKHEWLLLLLNLNCSGLFKYSAWQNEKYTKSTSVVMMVVLWALLQWLVKWSFLHKTFFVNHFNCFSAYKSVALSIFTMLFNYHHYQFPEFFHHPHGISSNYLFSLCPDPSNLYCNFCIYESYNSCPFLSGFFHLA